MEKQIDKTALSYWFSKIEAAGLPVPKTKIVNITPEAEKAIWAAIDGKSSGDAWPFYCKLADAANEIGFPCFLRTGHTSNKHQWQDTCYLKSAKEIPLHVFNLVEFSLCCDFAGLPWDVWVVREFLPTIPFGVCPRYGNMPICKEFRFFVDGGEVRCYHPYWPKEALEEGGAVNLDYEGLCRLADDTPFSLAVAAGAAVGGSWSVDILETRRGWFVTDMAEAEKSFHWEGCEKQ